MQVKTLYRLWDRVRVLGESESSIEETIAVVFVLFLFLTFSVLVANPR